MPVGFGLPLRCERHGERRLRTHVVVPGLAGPEIDVGPLRLELEALQQDPAANADRIEDLTGLDFFTVYDAATQAAIEGEPADLWPRPQRSQFLSACR